jgi:hypothetical protein
MRGNHEPKILIHRLDADSFNYLTVIAQQDTMTAPGVVTATILYGGYPVAMVTTDDVHIDTGVYQMPTVGDYRMSPLIDELGEWHHDSPQAQAYVAFLTEINAVDGDGAMAWVDEQLSMQTLFNEYGDDGHEWVAFLGEVAHAIHAAFPDITSEPAGF